MRNKIFITIIILIGLSSAIFSQSQFRSGIFLHHSTGMTIWGPNGSSTSIPNEMAAYNTAHVYTGANAVGMSQTWFPAGNDNEWVTWHNLFDDSNSSIQPYLQNNKIIVIKTCFWFSAYMTGVGSPADTLNPALKTIYNYKWHWRSIIRVMQQHPENFFVIWTNAPLVPSSTNSQQASLVNQFCTWAKDTLAEGNDPIFGSFPHNVYVFDFFHKVTDENGMLRLEYATSTTDSHPNGTATELVAPQFVQEIFDAAIYYESLTGIEEIFEVQPTEYLLKQNYPNPFNPSTIISWQTPVGSWQTLKVYDVLGNEIATLLDEYKPAGSYEIEFKSIANGYQLASGIYFYKLQAGSFLVSKKMIVLR